MASVRFSGLRKVYPSGYEALRAFDLHIEDGELMVLVGPSGSGKSTILRLLAGLEAPTAGAIFLGEQDVTRLDPSERDIAMVFQSYALYPHKSVRDNLGFGLRMRGVPKREIEARTREVAERLSLHELLDRKPAQLSGGQRQRVALGRALVRRPRAFLLDEPLSNLDAKLRVDMRAELGRLHAASRTTTLYVTHDQEEAMTLGERIAVLGPAGRIEQLAAPLEIYERPKNRFVAEFIGLPRINWFPGRIESGVFVSAQLTLPVPKAPWTTSLREVICGIRPHDLELCASPEAVLRGRAELVEALGHALLIHVQDDHGRYRVLTSASAGVRRGDRIALRPNSQRLHWFSPEDGQRLETP